MSHVKPCHRRASTRRDPGKADHDQSVTVGRLHLVDRFSYTWLLWGILPFTFLVNLAIFAVIPQTQPNGDFTGALLTIYIFMTVIGVQAATKFLPFAFTLGVSRRTYYLGTVALVVGLCAALRRDPHRALVDRRADRRLGHADAFLPGARGSWTGPGTRC